ncbi:hypothetical protein ES703_124836 [subsurface metagenome]
MHLSVVSLDVEPKGIDSGILKEVKVLGSETRAVGLKEYPESKVESLYLFGAGSVELGPAGEIPTGEGDDVPGRSKPLR